MGKIQDLKEYFNFLDKEPCEKEQAVFKLMFSFPELTDNQARNVYDEWVDR